MDLERFVTAQEPVYATALAELRSGRKRSHWMWFVLPQLAGLGHSPMAVRYGITDLDEAKAYADHPLLGARLRECAMALLSLGTSDAEQVMGPVDAMKLRSCMTLFLRAVPDERVFADALNRFYAGEPDPETDRLLGR